MSETERTKPIRQTVAEFPNLRNEPPQHTYRWDEIPEHVDPVKVAQAIDILHKGKHISDTDIQETRFNRRVEGHYENLRRQKEFRDELEPEQSEFSSPFENNDNENE